MNWLKNQKDQEVRRKSHKKTKVMFIKRFDSIVFDYTMVVEILRKKIALSILDSENAITVFY